jgi:DMSO/TMAO reductase YedYZ heme-binding membrane subunit
MKTYLKSIQFTQKFFLTISVLTMLILPLIIVFIPDSLSDKSVLNLYNISHVAVFFVMAIRPLADIFSRTNLVRPLVILRKGVGVFSAAIIISFIFSKIIMDPTGYVYAFGTVKYWSLQNFALLAHIADVSAILLLLTSNNLSKKIFGSWWKKIQKLSYPYFYASALYVFLITGHNSMLVSMFTITALTMIAYIKNKNRFQQQTI